MVVIWLNKVKNEKKEKRKEGPGIYIQIRILSIGIDCKPFPKTPIFQKIILNPNSYT